MSHVHTLPPPKSATGIGLNLLFPPIKLGDLAFASCYKEQIAEIVEFGRPSGLLSISTSLWKGRAFPWEERHLLYLEERFSVSVTCPTLPPPKSATGIGLNLLFFPPIKLGDLALPAVTKNRSPRSSSSEGPVAFSSISTSLWKGRAFPWEERHLLYLEERFSVSVTCPHSRLLSRRPGLG